MDEFKFPDMPCDACLRKLRFFQRQGVVPPIAYCDHGTSVVAIISRGFLCLREASDATHAFSLAMELEKMSVKAASAVLWQAMAQLPDDVKDPLEQAMRALMDAKPE